MDSRLVDSTQSTVRRRLVDIAESEQPTNTYESESADLQRSIEAYKSELIDLQQPTNSYEPKPNEESTRTFEPKLIMGGRRYPLRQRRAPSRYTNQYVLLTDEDELECYEEAIFGR